MSHKSPCPGKKSIANRGYRNNYDYIYYYDEDEDEDDDYFPPPPRLKRHVAVYGYCCMCGRITQESALRTALFCHYNCLDNYFYQINR